MNEQLDKSKQIEINIVTNLQQDRRVLEADKQDAFSAYSVAEQDTQLRKMERTALKVQQEDAMLHGVKSTYTSETLDSKYKMKVHNQAQNAYANLTWSQKRKLSKQQKKNLDDARKAGVQNATELTLPLSVARAEAEYAWSEQESVLTQEQREALRDKRPDANLFDERYVDKSAQPYDMTGMTARLRELELVKADMEDYRSRVDADPAAADWQLEVKFRAQDKLRISLGKAMEALYNANAVTQRSHSYLTPEELDMEKQELLKKCVTDYQQKAENYDLLVQDCKQELSRDYLQKEKESIPVNAADKESFGFSFAQRPAEIDAIRQLMNAPENGERVQQSKDKIEAVWREYIRLARTIDDKKTEMRLQKEKGGADFKAMLNANTSMVFRFEGLQDAYAAILRHFVAGEELDTYTDALLSEMLTKFGGSYTDHRLKTEKLYPETFTNERSEEVRKTLVDRANRQAGSIQKYFYSLPDDQVNKDMDPRILLSLCEGWNTDVSGQPLTEEDRQVMERETKWVRDLYGNDDSARHAVIDKAIEDYINIAIPWNVLQDDFALRDPVEVRKFPQRYLLLDNFKTGDPEYFESLSPQTKAKINFMSDMVVKLSTYLIYNQIQLTGIDESLGYVSDTNMANCKAITTAFKPELNEELRGLEGKMRSYVFDATTDTFTLEEQPREDMTFGVLRSPRFLTKLQNRAKKGLPCDDLIQVFDVMHGMTLPEYYDSIVNPQLTEQQKEDMRDSGFSGRTVHIDGMDFGTDDMARCAEVINKLSQGGADALEYGLDEGAAQALKQRYDLFREESYNNANIKIIYGRLAPFGDEFAAGIRKMKGHESEFSQLFSSMSQYHDIAAPKLDELERSMAVSDQKLKADLFLDIISVMDMHDVCFEKEHRAPLKAYMDDKTKDPVPEHSVSCTMNGVPLKLYGNEGELPELSGEKLEQKRVQLGSDFDAWLGELTRLLDDANAQFVRMKKYNGIAGQYYMHSNKHFEVESARLRQENKRKALDPQSPEYAELTAKIEENRQTEEREMAVLAEVPVFNQAKHKITTLQYELMMKETVCENNYKSTLEKIKEHLA